MRPIKSFDGLPKHLQDECKKELAPYIAQLGREKLLKNHNQKRKLEVRIDEIIRSYIDRFNDQK